jgi:signal transduction histidine kinase
MDAMEGTSKHLVVRSRWDGVDTVSVEVRDHGSGIRDLERIFDPFFTTKEKGMGMGLSICRSIVEAHDGRLSAQHNTPRGTIFTFSLPARPSDPGTASEEQEA